MKKIIFLVLAMLIAGQVQASRRESAELLILCARADFSQSNKALCGYAKALKDYLEKKAQDPLNDVPAYQDIMVPRDVACLYPSVRPTTFCDGLTLPPLPYKQPIPWPQHVAPILTTVKGKLIKPFIRASNINIPDERDFSVDDVCSLISDFAPHDRVLCSPSGKVPLIDLAVTQSEPWRQITHHVDFEINRTEVSSFEQQQLYYKIFSELEAYRQKLEADGFDVRKGKFSVTRAVIKGNADPSGAADKNLLLSIQRADNVTNAILQATAQLGVHCLRSVIEVARGENYDYGSCEDGTECRAPGYPLTGLWSAAARNYVCPRGSWKTKYDKSCLALARRAVVEL